MKDVADHPKEQNIIRFDSFCIRLDSMRPIFSKLQFDSIRFGLSQIIREFDSLSGAITEPERKSEILASVVPTSDVCLT